MSTLQVEIGQANRLGNRTSNQDRFTAEEREGEVLLVLADGMGGHDGGDLAAEKLIEVARDEFQRHARITDPARFYTRIVHRAHEAIWDLQEVHNLASVPGTTVVLCLVRGSRVSWAHVGDSRLYLFRDDLPLYRTRDHSYVESLYRNGAIESSERASHPQRSGVTRCIGCLPDKPEITFGEERSLRYGDVLLLCSDGLWGALDDATMGMMLRDGDLESALDRMVGQAEQNSYPRSDNVSALALRFLSETESTEGVDDKTRQHLRRLLGGKRNDKKKDPEALQNAIDQIEAVISKYRNEMKD